MSATATAEVATRPEVVAPSILDDIKITRAQALKAMSSDDLKAKVKSVREVRGAIGKVDDTVMFSAALLFYNGSEVSDLVGTQDGAAYATQRDYAKALGYSESYGSRLARLGRAAARHGVRNGSTQWTFLASHASHGAFASVLGKEAVSDEAFRTVLDEVMAEHAKTGKLPTGKRSAQPPTGTEGKDEGQAETPEPKAVKTPEDLIALIPGFEAVLHTLSDEGAAKVAKAYLAMLTSDRNRRKVLAEHEAEKQAQADAEAEQEKETTPEV